MEIKLEYNYFKKLLDKIGKEFVDELKRELAILGKSSSGKLINSISYKLTQNNNDWYIEIISEDYLKFVDKGRKPGKMPPIAAIKPWVEQRGIKMMSKSKDGKSGNVLTSESAAYLIARSIGEKGIKPTHVIEKVEKYIFSKYESQIKIAIGNDYKDYIKKSILSI